jgi:hypothetical protein
MAALHPDPSARGRHRDAIGEEQNGLCPTDQAGGGAGSPEQRFEFPSLRRSDNDTVLLR